jgi:hypothetical protein
MTLNLLHLRLLVELSIFLFRIKSKAGKRLTQPLRPLRLWAR